MKLTARSVRFPQDGCSLVLQFLLTVAYAQTDPLPSWNDGPAKQAILQFVRGDYRHNESELRGRRRSRIATFRSGRHNLGRASNVHAGNVLSGPGSGCRGEEA